MKKTLRTAALLGLLSLAATGCMKDVKWISILNAGKMIS